jgi:hypothetical protein
MAATRRRSSSGLSCGQSVHERFDGEGLDLPSEREDLGSRVKDEPPCGTQVGACGVKASRDRRRKPAPDLYRRRTTDYRIGAFEALIPLLT